MKSTFLLPVVFVFTLNCGDGSACRTADEKDSCYTNPVFEPDLADPTLVRAADNWFYAYGTENTWDDNKHRLIPVIKSKDLVNWEYVGEAFAKKPDWKEGGLWAPEIKVMQNKYYLYYAFSTWGDQNAGIGLAIADNPEGPFKDQGKLFDSHDIGVFNSIDPSVFEHDGKNYLIWGSLGGGIFGIELSPDGKSTIGDKFPLAGNSFEAATIYKKGQYYYLFMSTASCCEGPNSNYRVVVGRSGNFKGPYYTETGKDLMEYNNNWWVPAVDTIEGVILKGNSAVTGPGHNGQIITDDRGDDWFIYHAILYSDPWLPGGATRRPMFIDRIEWTGGWPVINKGEGPSINLRQKPYFDN